MNKKKKSKRNELIIKIKSNIIYYLINILIKYLIHQKDQFNSIL